jgi:hypothetical protein
MSTAASRGARIDRVEVTDEAITAHLADDRVISVPLSWSWRLRAATPAQRANYSGPTAETAAVTRLIEPTPPGAPPRAPRGAPPA